METRHGAEAIGPWTARGRHDQAEHRTHRLLYGGFGVYRALFLCDGDSDRVEGNQRLERLDGGGHLQRGRTMRMFGGVERTIGALAETQDRPERRRGPRIGRRS